MLDIKLSRFQKSVQGKKNANAPNQTKITFALLDRVVAMGRIRRAKVKPHYGQCTVTIDKYHFDNPKNYKII